MGHCTIRFEEVPQDNYEKPRDTRLNEARIREISCSSLFFLLILAYLEIGPARGSTHGSGEVEMDERCLDRDESTKLVYTTQGGDWGQGTWLIDLDLPDPDLGFFVTGVFLLESPCVRRTRDDAVFDEGTRIIMKAGKRSELLDNRVRRLATTEATTDEHTSDPGTGNVRSSAICLVQEK